MKVHKRVALIATLLLWLVACKHKKSTTTPNPQVINNEVAMNVADIVAVTVNNSGKLTPTLQLGYPNEVKQFYDNNGNNAVWSKRNKFNKQGIELLQFISQSMNYGLFPEDYYNKALINYQNLLSDTAKANKQTILAQADLLLTDAYVKIAHDLKVGRLSKDSLTITADTALKINYYVDVLNKALKSGDIVLNLQQQEPKHTKYKALKAALPAFLQTMDTKQYSYIVYPNKDSMQLVKQVTKRLFEAGVITQIPENIDSAFYTKMVLKYQISKSIKQTGKVNVEMAKALNTSPWYQFKRIAATLDKYKTLAKTMPETYVWVNLPSFKMQVVNHDTTVIESKVIVGKVANKTPELNSEISNIVLYPTWSVPYSIAIKEMLPIAKRNPGYFAKRGFKVFNSRGKQVNPYSVNWSKYSKTVPFNFRQNEGGGNALGVIKFNFENPFSVYLHDTNQRYMFERTYRALSHGCVRVQLWDSVARYLIAQSRAYYPEYEVVNRDSITLTNDTITLSKTYLRDSAFIIADSLKRYMAKKKNMALLMSKRIPIFIRYYGCDTSDGKIVFYDDIYAEDKQVIDQFFAKK